MSANKEKERKAEEGEDNGTRKDVCIPLLMVVCLLLVALPSVVVVIFIAVQTSPGQIIFVKSTIQPPLPLPDHCDVGEMGNDFRVVFMENDNSTPTHILDIYPIPRGSANISVSVRWSETVTPVNSSYDDIRLRQNEHRAIRMPDALQLSGIEQATKGVTIRATDRIGVYALNKHESTCDGFLVLPRHLLGTRHYVVCFFPEDKMNQVSFVAAEDDTTVTMVLRKATRPALTIRWNGTTVNNRQNITVRLNKDEAVQIKAGSDLSGCGVHSDKPIAVFAGNDLTRVVGDLSVDQNGTWTKNYLVEQIPAVEHWGTTFYLVPLVYHPTDVRAATPGYLVKFVSSVGNTLVRFRSDDSNQTITFWLGQPGDLNQTFVAGFSGSSIRSDNPILVAQMFASSDDQSPSMMLVTPRERCNSRYVFPTPKYGDLGSSSSSSSFFYNFVQITIDYNETDYLYLDGVPLRAEWTRYSNSSNSGGGDDNSNVAWTSLSIEDGVHTLHHNRSVPFGASLVGHSGGTTKSCSYAYPAGLCA